MRERYDDILGRIAEKPTRYDEAGVPRYVAFDPRLRGVYDDVTSRIAEDPAWHDEVGVPRYIPFHPSVLKTEVNEAALLEVVCQECLRTFTVCCTGRNGKLAERIKEFPNYIYGRPPGHRGDDLQCGAGDFLKALTVRIIECWQRTDDVTWSRDSSLELVVEWDEEEAERIRRGKWTATREQRRAPWFDHDRTPIAPPTPPSPRPRARPAWRGS